VFSSLGFYQRLGFVEVQRMRELNLDLEENGGDEREVESGREGWREGGREGGRERESE
jgi:hypothetical protein